uniref:Uncharacterized protein n=1 Tax=Tetranychus urticae TaxID=32264 RepID=T1JUM6_TETUR
MVFIIITTTIIRKEEVGEGSASK